MTLSKKEVQRISSRSIRGCDKFHRMYMGIASELERYEQGIMYLRVENTEKTWPSNFETAVKFSHMWLNWNEELTYARGFVVSFYKSGTTGFAVAFSNEGLVYERIQEVIAESKRQHKLMNIFSGVFKETKEEEELSWAQHNKQSEQGGLPPTQEQSDSIEDVTDKQGEGWIIGM